MNENSHFQHTLDLYRQRGKDSDFWALLDWYLRHGYVHSTPEYFAMFQPIRRGQEKLHAEPCQPIHADCWYFHFLTGSLEKFVLQIPYPLQWAAFGRWWIPGELRYYPFARITHLISTLSTNGQRQR